MELSTGPALPRAPTWFLLLLAAATLASPLWLASRRPAQAPPPPTGAAPPPPLLPTWPEAAHLRFVSPARSSRGKPVARDSWRGILRRDLVQKLGLRAAPTVPEAELRAVLGVLWSAPLVRALEQRFDLEAALRMRAVDYLLPAPGAHDMRTVPLVSRRDDPPLFDLVVARDRLLRRRYVRALERVARWTALLARGVVEGTDRRLSPRLTSFEQARLRRALTRAQRELLRRCRRARALATAPAPPPERGPLRPVLDLTQAATPIENLVELTASPAVARSMRGGSTSNTPLALQAVRVNGPLLPLRSARRRGGGSRHHRRKSLTLRLGRPATFRRGGRTKRLRSFFLISLNGDRGYFRSMVALDLLDDLGLFPLFRAFCELRLNGKSEGVYLVLQRPKQYARDEPGLGFLARKLQNRGALRADLLHRWGATPWRLDDFARRFLDLYRVATVTRGARRVEALDRRLHLDRYLAWLAFDHLVRNADAGQVFLMAPPGLGPIRFDVLPWDYDRAFDPAARDEPGQPILHKEYDDLLDEVVRADPVLLARYRRVLSRAAARVASAARPTFERVHRELQSYYAREDVLENAEHDRFGRLSAAELRREMAHHYRGLLNRCRRQAR